MAPFLADNATGGESVDVLSEELGTSTLEPTQTLADSMKPTPQTQQTETEDEWVYPYPTNFKLSEKPIDEHRDLEVSPLVV